MSTPPSECNDERENDKKKGQSRRTRDHAAPLPEMGEAYPRARARQRGSFVGDAAAVQLRNRLAQGDDQEDDQVPVPPSPDSSASMFAGKGRLVGAATVIVAAAALGYLW